MNTFSLPFYIGFIFGKSERISVLWFTVGLLQLWVRHSGFISGNRNNTISGYVSVILTNRLSEEKMLGLMRIQQTNKPENL